MKIHKKSNSSENALFLSHHNIIQSRFYVPPAPEKPPSEMNAAKPLFLTSVNSILSRQKKHQSFSQIPKLENSYTTLKSFHHQVQFEKFRKTFSSEKKPQTAPLKAKQYLMSSPKNNRGSKACFYPVSPKKMSLFDVCNILNQHNSKFSCSLKDSEAENESSLNALNKFIDPSVDLRKFSIKKDDRGVFELRKGGKLNKKRARLSILPINNPDLLQCPSSSRGNPLGQFLQKSLKGNQENIEKSNIQAEYKEVQEDIAEIRDKLYQKLRKKPLERKEDSIFKFSEKTMIALGSKLTQMREVYDQGKNPIDIRNYKEIGVPKLTFEQLAIVKNQYSLDKERRDYHTLEVLTKNLKFFHQLSRDVRQIVLRSSELKSFQNGDVIIDESNKGLSAFIILSGGVNIRGTYSQKSLQSDIVLTSLYDGDYFGDFSNEFAWNFSKKAKKGLLMIKEPYVVAFETTETLCMSFDLWSGVLMGMRRRDMNEKMEVLTRMEVWKDEERTTLMALAGAFTVRSYKMGEVLVREGDEVESFFIVAKGRCAIIFGRGGFENVHGLEEDQEIKKGSTDKKKKEGLNRRRSPSLPLKSLDPVLSEYHPTRVFPKEAKRDVIANLNELDFFCERALLSEEELRKKSMKVGEELGAVAKLTVAADKEGTVIMEMERKHFLLLPNEIQTRVKNIFAETLEFDSVNREKLELELQNWESVRKEISHKFVKKP